MRDIICVLTEWKPEHFSDIAVLLSKCEDVYSADVPSSIQVSLLNTGTIHVKVICVVKMSTVLMYLRQFRYRY